MKYSYLGSTALICTFLLLLAQPVYAQEDVPPTAKEEIEAVLDEMIEEGEGPFTKLTAEAKTLEETAPLETAKKDAEVEPKSLSLCETGALQSPIDLKSTAALKVDLPNIEIDYKTIPITILNDGHTVQVNIPEGSAMTIDGKAYSLTALQFHTPSEHYIDGQPFPMEVKFIHKDEAGALSILGAMIKEGAAHTEAAKIWKHLPPEPSIAMTYYDGALKPSKLLPETLTYYRYMGSLTAPPCTEGVNWYVLTAPIEFSKEQIDQFKEVFSANARPLQNQNHRMILLDK